MSRLLVGVADDISDVHEAQNTYVGENLCNVELKHFYTVDRLLDYLDDSNNESLDMLFLDIVFEGGMTGIEALPIINDLAPDMPVIVFTGYKEYPGVDEMIENKLAIDYIEKPISKREFILKIKSVHNTVTSILDLKQKLTSNEEVLDAIQEEYNQMYNEELEKFNKRNNELAQDEEILTKMKNDFEAYMEEIANSKIPNTIKDLFTKTFSNLEFRAKVLVELFGKNYDDRIFTLLNKINNNLELGTGVKIQLFPEFGIPCLYEYRISQKARLFIQRRPGMKQLVYEVDYNHDKH